MMTQRKFKLIKEYPGSPKIGTEVNYDQYWKMYMFLNNTLNTSFIIPTLVENQQEYWKDIIDKKYEILSYSYEGRIYKYNGINTVVDRQYTCGFGIINESTKDKLTNVTIHSIKRISDNEIFTIGDKISKGIISKFEVSVSGSTIIFTTESGYQGGLSVLDKTKILFTTEDGIEVIDRNTILYWTNITNYSSWTANDDTADNIERLFISNNSTHAKIFSTKEACDNYITYNKPCLSLNEVIEIGRIRSYRKMLLEKFIKEKLK